MAFMGSKTVDVKVFFDKELAQEVVEQAAIKGLRKLAELIVTKAQQNCPRDTGTLARSIVESVGFEPNMNEIYEKAKIGDVPTLRARKKAKEVYISANTPYALRQHEEHRTKSKYLERAFNEYKDKAQYFAENKIAEATLQAKAKKWGYDKWS